jgi:leucyl aminopeptidase
VDLVAVVLDDEKTLHEIDDPALRAHVERAGTAFRDKTLKREYFATLPEGATARALVVYWSPQLKSWNLWENVKTFTARAMRLARDYRLARVALVLNAKDAAPLVGKAVEGAVLGTHVFDRYKQEKDDFYAKEASLTVLVHPDHQADAEARKARYAWVAENVNRARDLINEPGNVVTPEAIAAAAAEAAREVELEVEVLDPAALEAKGYRGILRVGAGSASPGRMVILRHVPKKASKETIALVGKGITFDSGGISLKPGEKMWEMKGDMAGAAAVLYAMRSLGKIRPDVKVLGILCCAENMPDANAQRPGDIFTAKNGKSVMVDNTDAEGRLVLLDGLARAGRGGGDPRRRHRHPHRGRGARARAERRRGDGHRPRARAPGDPLRGEPRGAVLGAAPRRGVQGVAQDPLRRPQQHRGGRAGRGHHRRPLPARVRAERGGVGPPRHRGADVQGQGVEVLRRGGDRLRGEDPRGPVRALP